jgi:hypothetical protein
MTVVTEEVFKELMLKHNATMEEEFEVEPYTTRNYFDKEHNLIGHSRQYGYGGDTIYKVKEELIV